MRCIKLRCKIKDVEVLHCSVKDADALRCNVKTEFVYKTQKKSVIPSNIEKKVTPDEGYLLEEVTVGKIPNNYGLITWNGYSILVS